MWKSMKKKIRTIPKLGLALLLGFSSLNIPIQANAASLYNEATLSVTKGLTLDLSNTALKKNNAYMYNMTMKGKAGFCLDLGKRATTGTRFARTRTKTNSTYNRIYNYVLNDNLLNHYLESTPGVWSDNNRAAAQALIWCYENNIKGEEAGVVLYNVIKAIWPGISNAPGYILDEWANNAFDYNDDSGTLYVYDSGLSNYQRILTSTPGEEVFLPKEKTSSTKSFTANESVEIHFNKTDDNTGKGLEGVSVDFYRDDVQFATATTSDGKASSIYKNNYTESATVSATYYEGYDDLSEPNKELIGDTDFSSYSEAKAYCDKEALAKAKALAEAEAGKTHTYKAVETNTRHGYVLNSNPISQAISGSGIVNLSLTNHRQEGNITITKLDSETNQTVANAIYKLYAKNDIVHPDGKTGVIYPAGTEIATFPSTNSNGNAILNHLYLGNYYIQEATAPNGYLLNSQKYDVSLTYAGQTVEITDTNTSAKDTVVRGNVLFNKKDKELYNVTQDKNIVDSNSDGAQGDALLKGATYGLYAANNIVHKDGKTGVISYNQTNGSIHEIQLVKGSNLEVKNTPATAGTLLATAQTDVNGQIQFNHLYLGDYYIQEINPSTGYLLNSQKYSFSLTYAGQTVSVVTEDVTGTEQVKKQAFELQKFGHMAGQSGVAKPLKDVQFTVKLESDVLRLGWDKAPTYDVLTTDDKGYAKSKELPYGYYRVRETKTPDGWNTAQDFFVSITEDSRTPQHFSNQTVIDENYQSMLKIVKTDSESGKTVKIPGATFKIKANSNVSVNGVTFKAGEYIKYTEWAPYPHVVETWSTNEEGYVILQEKLSVGSYQLEEVASVNGYLISKTPLKFTISADNMTNTDTDINVTVPTQTVKFANIPVKGQIKVYKEGEVLDGFDNDFTYIVKGLPGAEYKITAKEDILDPADRSVIYKAGSYIETIKTNSDGNAISSQLYLGKYHVEETKAPNGFVLNSKGQDVTLAYKDEVTPLVYDTATFKNERQKVSLNVIKKDSDKKVPLSGAQFGSYAEEDIKNYKGEIIVKKGTLLEKQTSNEEGQVEFTLDYPLEYQFNVKELKAPDGYATSDEFIIFNPTYDGQDKEITSLTKDFMNDITKVSVSKKDITTSDEIENCLLAVYPVIDDEIQYGEVFDTWYSGKTPHMIEGLEINKEYALVELNPADGYSTAKIVYFTVKDTPDIQKVEMINQLTDVEVAKIDSDLNLVEGAVMAIYPVDENDNPILGECFETWATEKETHHIQGLVVGQKYMIRELTAPFDKGYVTAKDTIFTVEDSLDSQLITIEDNFTQIEINKVDKETQKNLSGNILALYPIDDNDKVQYGECFDTWMTDDSSHRIERIPVGKYLLKELSKVDGYTYAKDMIIEVKDTAEVQVYTMENDFNKIEIDKTDMKTNESIIGALMGLYPVANGEIQENPYETWVTDGNVHRIDRIPAGEYAIVEITTPENSGYIKAEPIFITIKDSNDIQSFVMTDDYTKVEISKQDITTSEELKDATLQIIDKETQEIIKEVVTNGEKTLIENILQPNHDYILREASAPNGYLISNDVDFHVNEIGEIQKVVMKDDYTKIEIMKYNDNKEILVGADFIMYDSEGKEVAKWTSGQEAFRIERLTVGEEYTIKEVKTPNGYDTMKDFTFKVENTGNVQSISLFNNLTPVVKTGDNTNISQYTVMLVSSAMLGIILGYIVYKKKKED